MKRATFLTVVFGLGWTTGLWAGDPPQRPTEKRIEVRRGKDGKPSIIVSPAGPQKSAAERYVERLDKIVKLTDDQKKKVAELIEAREKAVKEWQTQNSGKLAEASKALRKAMSSKDKDAIAKARKDYQEAQAPWQELVKKYEAEVEKVLTLEQRETLKKVNLGSAGAAAPIIVLHGAAA